MSKKATELEAAALATSWNPASQAALYHIHLAQQAERDEQKAIAEAEKREKKLREDVRPDEVKAGEVVDTWIKRWCPPLFDFLDVFAPPHLAIGIFIILHVAYWYAAPWYLHFLLIWPMTYIVPLYGTWGAMREPATRVLWLSYWPIVSIIEYLEILLFRDQARALVWWPKLKAIFCVVMYCVVENEPILDSKGRLKGTEPVYGAVKLVKRLLPSSARSARDNARKGEGKSRS
ncbi:hypothetical protein IAU60_000781 [Kwoniella sp. DSM 27419]